MPPGSQRSTAYSMYARRSFLPPPGPGAYQRGVNDSTLMLGDRAKAFHGDGFDQSRALLKERTGRPSPCDYSPSTLRSGRGLWSGRSSSIGLPLLPPPNRNPGPGEYSPMRPRAVGKSFGAVPLHARAAGLLWTEPHPPALAGGDGFNEETLRMKELHQRPGPAHYSPSVMRSGGRSLGAGTAGYTISRRDFSWDLPDLGGGYGSRGPAMLWRGEELRCARARYCRK